MISSETGTRISKIQELVYEMKVGSAMTDRVISVAPETAMSELRALLRDNRISGVPVRNGDSVVGVISVEDYINWLATGGVDCTVGERMSCQVTTLYHDEPLVHAISALERHGYGRLPVIERGTRKLVGVITKGDIIEGLLQELEVGFHEEEIQRYRASHFFEDMIADEITISFDYHIRGQAVEEGGEVAGDLKKSLKRLGIHPDSVRRAAIATYEAEMKLIIYAEEGTVHATVDPRHISICVTDRGPGIADVDRAMEVGYSTAPDWVRELGFGAGMGLGNIKKCAHTMALSSEVGRGARLKITIPMERTCTSEKS